MDAICLCLDKRKEHWLRLEEQCVDSKIKFHRFIAGDGSDPELSYDYIDNPNPDVSRWIYGRQGYKHHLWNATECHKRMILKAKEAYMPWVLFLEDDGYITERFDDIFQDIENCLPYFNWHVVYLGWWRGDENDEFNTEIEKNWQETHKSHLMPINFDVGGLHGVLIHSSVYDYILSLPPVNCIDAFLNGPDGLLRYLVTPKIIHTKTMYFNTEGCILTRKVL